MSSVHSGPQNVRDPSWPLQPMTPSPPFDHCGSMLCITSGSVRSTNVVCASSGGGPSGGPTYVSVNVEGNFGGTLLGLIVTVCGAEIAIRVWCKGLRVRAARETDAGSECSREHAD